MLYKSVTLKVQAQLYDKADVVLKGLNMSMPQAFEKYLEQIVNEKSNLNHASSLHMDEALEAYLEWF